jgi:hypothetical protein
MRYTTGSSGIDVVVDHDIRLVRMTAVQAPGVPDERSPPCDGHGQQQRVEARVVEALDVATAAAQRSAQPTTTPIETLEAPWAPVATSSTCTFFTADPPVLGWTSTPRTLPARADEAGGPPPQLLRHAGQPRKISSSPTTAARGVRSVGPNSGDRANRPGVRDVAPKDDASQSDRRRNARILPDGTAVAPSQAPAAVKLAIAAGNLIHTRSYLNPSSTTAHSPSSGSPTTAPARRRSFSTQPDSSAPIRST